MDVLGRLVVPPEDLAGRASTMHMQFSLRRLDAVVDLQSRPAGVEVADVEVVGMAQAGRPQGRAVVVEHDRAEEHFVAAVVVDVGRSASSGRPGPGTSCGSFALSHRHWRSSSAVAKPYASAFMQLVGAPGDDQAGRLAVEIRDAKLVARGVVVAAFAAAEISRDGQSIRAIGLPVRPSRIVRYSGPDWTRPSASRGSPSPVLTATSALPSPSRS